MFEELLVKSERMKEQVRSLDEMRLMLDEKNEAFEIQEQELLVKSG